LQKGKRCGCGLFPKSSGRRQRRFCWCRRFDPMRQTRLSFCATLKKLGWQHKRDDNITEGVNVLASLQDKYVAYEVRCWFIPGVSSKAGRNIRLRWSRSRHRASTHSRRSHPSPQTSPVNLYCLLNCKPRMTSLSRAYAPSHPLCLPRFCINSGGFQGWKVVWVPQTSWMDALKGPKQHDKRHELLVDLTLAQEPFTPRIHA
jgi:hypothetical protein